MNRWLVMVAGPYRSGAVDDAGRRANLRALEDVALEVHARGHVPIIGVHVALPIIGAAGGDRYDEIMLPLCLRLADRCDAVIRIGGPSKGADAEVARVLAHGGRWLRSVAELPSA